MLNELAQCGMNLGNFIYIDNNEPNYKETLINAINDTIDLAIDSAGSSNLVMTNSNSNF